MNELVCGDCWRREHLTFVQRLDPAFIRHGSRYLCPEHRALRAELSWATGPVHRPIPDPTQNRAA
ncbi:hypothetical protein [Nocardia macrotermitis]|uniref:Uncharacterized protein n=1 Tax=Nocardia macrotermitis TaxID=2585198 RepID=A0A7K0D4J0_9NOCA|nr:hypothetical protein [Nocardia macrotermitis]MQY20640.1 hypothetical protein [Nocardia macrotermitis]